MIDAVPGIPHTSMLSSSIRLLYADLNIYLLQITSLPHFVALCPYCKQLKNCFMQQSGLYCGHECMCAAVTIPSSIIRLATSGSATSIINNQ